MQIYKRNKLQTALAIIRLIRNWPVALKLRLFKRQRGLRLLEFRNGLYVLLRGGTREWDVVHELFFAGGYGKALRWLTSRREREPKVIDLGGNIGLFSLLAYRHRAGIKITAYEPGPPNIRMFRMNLLANDIPPERITIHEQAVAGTSGEAVWYFDSANPGGSSLYGSGGETVTVSIRGFAEVIEQSQGDIALIKMDIEGAEFDLLEHTPAATWNRIQALALELHDDPSGRKSPQQFLAEMRALGYQIEEESVCSYFLYRPSVSQ